MPKVGNDNPFFQNNLMIMNALRGKSLDICKDFWIVVYNSLQPCWQLLSWF